MSYSTLPTAHNLRAVTNQLEFMFLSNKPENRLPESEDLWRAEPRAHNLQSEAIQESGAPSLEGELESPIVVKIGGSTLGSHDTTLELSLIHI